MTDRSPAPARRLPRRHIAGLGPCGLALGCAALGVALAVGAAAQEAAREAVQEAALIEPLAPKSLLLDGIAVDGLMVAVGERGHILLSGDQGATWRQANVPTRATLTAVFFHDRQLGWAVGHDAVILRTRDGGENWELVYQAPEEQRPLLDVWFADADHGFAIGAYSYFLVTDDGGDSWSPRDLGAAAAPSAGAADEDEEAEDEYIYDDYDPEALGVQFHLNQITRASGGRLYIAAEAGNAYRSDDGGETWITLPSPYEGSFFGTLPLAGDSLLLFGLRGHLFRSDDAGESWRAIETGTTAMLTDALVLRDGTVVVAGLAGTLLVSRDGGETFTLRQQADRQGLATVLQADHGDLVLVGDYGVEQLPLAALEGGAAL